MKTFNNLFIGLCIIGSILFVSCKKTNDVQPTNQSTSPNFSFKGGLAFRVKKDGNAVPNATIKIAVSQSDLSSDIILASKNTDGNGYADFGKLNGGNYYYKVDVTIGITPYHGEGVVQVQNGVDLV
ncbi:MAG: hypothetical protein HYU69_02035 [Bacteroidetes bacterium]|nr:hypothetical protein [Bacteroidota bacterium]